MRRVQQDTHQDTRDSSCDGNRHDPGEYQEPDSLEVDGSQGTVAETDTDGGTGDTHRSRDGKGVLREDEYGDGGTHLHRTSSGGGMVGDLVTHDLHDVVTVSDETDRDGTGQYTDLPERHGELGFGGVTGVPCRVDDGPGSDRVTDIVGTVGERGGTGGKDLDERVGVFDLVGVFLGSVVNPGHSVALGSTVDTGLSGVDVVVQTVKRADDDHGGKTFGEESHVVSLVDRSGSHGVLVQCPHGPTERSLGLSHLGMHLLLAQSHLRLVRVFQLGESGLRERRSGERDILLVLEVGS